VTRERERVWQVPQPKQDRRCGFRGHWSVLSRDGAGCHVVAAFSTYLSMLVRYVVSEPVSCSGSRPPLDPLDPPASSVTVESWLQAMDSMTGRVFAPRRNVVRLTVTVRELQPAKPRRPSAVSFFSSAPNTLPEIRDEMHGGALTPERSERASFMHMSRGGKNPTSFRAIMRYFAQC
jgi:hypothetical protein